MKYAIGIDIGAAKIKGVLAGGAGKILACLEIPTGAKRKRAAILRDILKFIDCLKGEAEVRGLKLEGIGVGVPGTIKAGKLVFGGGTLKQFVGVDFKNLIQKKTGLKTALENDSAVFVSAESYFGAGKNFDRVAGVIWGSGIGGGIFDKNNRPRVPARAVEIGHFIVEPDIKNEPKCGCGKRGCAENLASGKNIVRRYYARGGKMKNAGVREIYFSKEKAARKVLDDAYGYLGRAIAVFADIINPDIIVIGGGVSNLPEPAFQKLRKYSRRHLVKMPAKKLKITRSKLGNFSGALGAAMLLLAR